MAPILSLNTATPKTRSLCQAWLAQTLFPELPRIRNQSPDLDRQPGQVTSGVLQILHAPCVLPLTDLLEGGYFPALPGKETRCRGNVTCWGQAAS